MSFEIILLLCSPVSLSVSCDSGRKFVQGHSVKTNILPKPVIVSIIEKKLVS